MTDSRSELMAEALQRYPQEGGSHRQAFIDGAEWGLAASQPDREMVARAATQAALTALRAGGDNLAIFNAVNESLSLLLVGGDQRSIATKQSTDATGNSASETALHENGIKCAAMALCMRTGGNDARFNHMQSVYMAEARAAVSAYLTAVAETDRNAPENVGLLSGVSSDPPSSAGERMRERLAQLQAAGCETLTIHQVVGLISFCEIDAALSLQGPSGKTGGEG